MRQFSRGDIGVILKNLRKAAHMTQKEAADAIGRNLSVIGHCERGYTSIDANDFLKLCLVYKADINEAFGINDCHFTTTLEFASDEIALIKDYRSLNDQGREYVRQSMYMAVSTYKKHSNAPNVEAAEKTG